MQNTIHNRIPKRQRWHSGIHPFWYTQSCIYTLPWAHVLPTQLFWFSYLQIPAGIHWVAVSTNFHPERPSFLPYQGYIFFVSNKFQNEICPALIISNVIPYFRVVSGRQIGIRKTNSLLCLLVFSGQCLLVCICCFGDFLVLFF